MKISVVIPAYNEENYIQKCLDGFLAQEVPPDEIIVVDNNSTDTTADIVKKYPGVRLVKQPIQGMTPARNKGFDTAQYDIIARTDADTIVSPDWVKKIKEAFEKDSILIALSGPSIIPSTVDDEALSRIQSHLFFRSYNSSFKYLVGHHVLYGPNMAIRKTAWDKIRDEVCLDDKKVHEDVDLAIHIGTIGKIYFDSRLIVSASSRRLTKLKTYYEYPYRYLRTIQHHKAPMDRGQLMKSMNPENFLKKNKYTRKFFEPARH